MALEGEAKKVYQRELMRKRRELAKQQILHTRDLETECDLGKEESVVESATSEETGGVTPEAGVVVERPMTRTDRAFENDRPNYYIFKQDAVERACWACGVAFKTRMELNKFCSPKCKNSWLTSAFGKLKASKPEHAAI